MLFRSPWGPGTFESLRGIPGKDSIVPGPQGDQGDKGDEGDVGEVGPPGATGKTHAFGNVSGTVTCDLAESTFAFTMTITGDVVIKFKNWPAGLVEPELYVTQDASGGHSITIENAIWAEETPPVFEESPNAVNIIPLSSPDGGTHIHGLRGLLGSEAGGDLGGAFPNPKVVTIDGKAVTAVVFDEDSRLADARVPTAHAVSHQKGGSDPLYLFGDNMSNATRIENFPGLMAGLNASATAGTPTVTSGRCYLLYFTAPYDLTISKLFTASPLITPQFTYASGFTRYGLMTLAKPDTAEETALLVARTAEDKTVGAAQNTFYSLDLATAGGFPASFKLERGVRYAYVFFSNAAVIGKILGTRMPATYAGGTSFPPFKVRNIDGQSDIPTAEVGNGKGTTIANSTGDCLWMGAR